MSRPKRIAVSPRRAAAAYLALGLTWLAASAALLAGTGEAGVRWLALGLAVAFLVVTTALLLRLLRWQRAASRLERDARDARRFETARESFIAAAAHELRTPLAVVKASAQLMARRGQGDPAALETIDRQVDRLTRMTQSLLDGSRFRLGGAELARERLELRVLVEEVADSLRPQTDGRSIEVAAEPAEVLGDRTRLAQVVSRLVENALRFSPRGGVVRITLRAAREARVEVHDDGPGIAPERQALVFDRPFHASAVLDEAGAFGGALDVSHEIVARHGGRMWLESAVGRGSTFAFSLPLAPGRPEGAEAPAAPTGRGG